MNAHDLIDVAHAQLATFARESFQASGRGVIIVHLPDLPPDALVATELAYRQLEEIRPLAGALTGPARASADVLIRMLEDYDPARQAVVTVAIGRGLPTTITMKLTRPIVVGEADGVH